MPTHSIPLCPSVSPKSEGAQVFAVIGGTPEQPRAAYLDQPLPMSDELLALAGQVDTAELFRAAATCAAGACQHFDVKHEACRLVRKTVQLAPVAVQRLPRCAIRPDCRWWRQEGAAACLRCPQVVTMDYASSSAMRLAADPQVC